jgi:hypothetical protein
MQTCPESRKNMTLTIHLAPETEKKLQELAARAGQSLERYVEHLAEKEVRAANGRPGTPQPSAEVAIPLAAMTFDQILAPVRKEFEESGMTEEEIDRLLRESLDEVRAARRKVGQ